MGAHGAPTVRRGAAALAALAIVALLAVPLAPSAGAIAPHPALCGFSCAHPWDDNVSVTIANSMASPTGVYEQRVIFPSASFAASLNSNWSNAYAVYANGSAIPTWVEANNSNASLTTIVWLHLWSIPASSSVTVYLDIVVKTAFLPSLFGPVGWAPTLGATYGAWDDGARVFPLYDNFSGSVLNSALWSVSAPSGTVGHLGSVAVSNGLTVTLGTCGGYPAPCDGGIVGTTALAPPVVLDGLTTAVTGAGGYAQTPSTTNTTLGYEYIKGGTNLAEGAMNSLTFNAATYSGPAPAATHVVGIAWVTGSTGFAYFDRAAPSAWSHTALSLPATVTPYVGLFQYSGSAAHLSATWVRERPFLTTVPTVTIGARVSTVPTWVSLVWLSPTNVSLAWSDASPAVVNYTLRSGPSCGAWNVTISVGSNATTLVRHGLVGAVEYCMTLQATTALGNSNLSATTAVVPPDVIVPHVTVTPPAVNVTLPWVQLAIVDVLVTVVVLLIAAKMNRDRDGGREIVDVGKTKSADDLTDAEIERANMYTAGAGQRDESLYAAPRRKP